jgi:hypothetical protein
LENPKSLLYDLGVDKTANCDSREDKRSCEKPP